MSPLKQTKIAYLGDVVDLNSWEFEQVLRPARRCNVLGRYVFQSLQ